MTFHPHNIYHIYNQGNNRQTVFFKREDYLTFLSLYKNFIYPNVSTIAWCLMPNHFHFMVYADERCNMKIKQGGIFIDPVTNGIRKLLSGYARIFNANNQRTGSVFRQKTKAKCLSDIKISGDNLYRPQDYFINCFNYIHQHPYVAKLVLKLEDWEYSSFPDYAGLRDGTLCQKDLAIAYCGYDPGNFIAKSYQLPDKKIIELIE